MLSREGLLDIHPDPERLPDYYLVLTGPKSPAMTSRGRPCPWVITDVFLFEAQPLITRLCERGVKTGVATSIVKAEWEATRIYPVSRESPGESRLMLTPTQEDAIRLFDFPDGDVKCE